jgi:hypothetical protein
MCKGAAIEGGNWHIPVAEAEPKHSIKLGELLTWYTRALDATMQDAESMERRPGDGAPDAEDLRVTISIRGVY